MDFGPLPQKRELPSYAQKQNPEELALSLVRQRGALAEKHRKDLAAAGKEADRLAEQLALLVHKKRFTEGDPFVLSLRQLLKNEGISLITYAGEEVTEELENEADIVEWLPAGEETVDRVVDALEPEIRRQGRMPKSFISGPEDRRQGRILHRAKLSCRQGLHPEIPAPALPSEPQSAAEPAAEPAKDSPAPAPKPNTAPRTMKKVPVKRKKPAKKKNQNSKKT